MIKPLAAACGLAMVATQTTPFDLMGVHPTPYPTVELTFCLLTVIGLLLGDR